MTPNEKKEVQKMVELDLKMNDDVQHTKKKIRDLPMIFHKYLNIFHKERRLQEKLLKEKRKLYKEKYHFYKFEQDFRLDSAKEIELYVNGDKEFNELCYIVNLQNNMVEYMENVISNIKQKQFGMRNIIEYEKFISGI